MHKKISSDHIGNILVPTFKFGEIFSVIVSKYSSALRFNICLWHFHLKMLTLKNVIYYRGGFKENTDINVELFYYVQSFEQKAERLQLFHHQLVTNR